MMQKSASIRPASISDLAEINSIFNYYVANSTCVWQTEPVSEAGRLAWYQAHDADTPVVVAEREGRIVGWASLSRFRAFYRTVEDSIYAHKDHLRTGIGSLLLADLIRIGNERKLNSIVAVISAEQEASIALHAKFRFAEVGRMQRVGYKLGKWLDVVFMHYRFRSSAD